MEAILFPPAKILRYPAVRGDGVAAVNVDALNGCRSRILGEAFTAQIRKTSRKTIAPGKNRQSVIENVENNYMDKKSDIS